MAWFWSLVETVGRVSFVANFLRALLKGAGEEEERRVASLEADLRALETAKREPRHGPSPHDLVAMSQQYQSLERRLSAVEGLGGLSVEEEVALLEGLVALVKSSDTGRSVSQ